MAGPRFVGCTNLKAYDLGLKLGEGTFGVVTKGIQIVTKRAVALKQLLTHNPRDGVSTTTIREIKILKSLSHPNVVPILDMVVNPKNKEKSARQDIFMVFPFMDHDLCGLLGNQQFKPTVSIVKLIMKQMLEGLAYIHENNIIHRDIKTANILVDKRGQVMIADFGLARSWTGSGPLPPHTMNEYTNMVVTRWYRAPELLLGDTHYGPAVDMWSMGCILGEMFHREPILAAKGQTDDGQLPLILEHCGPLNDETFPGWQDLPGYPEMQGRRWDFMDECSSHLLRQMLCLDPVQRITADQALDHPWFWVTPLPATVDK
ncbi:kinase-like domain-containing protein [Kockovaella imperatae]|uniref:Kinase-like domain-containing protein n=1 Tax=Kockovaella imperatae TaxID=4999 RepID=A0A1Y1UE77_9TREE|nr:kinase-like domain-containing protein [Kockovaella imperatae]ORX36332.1 kinase-like domain-containing protein [Kockovaella imperatae]